MKIQSTYFLPLDLQQAFQQRLDTILGTMPEFQQYMKDTSATRALCFQHAENGIGVSLHRAHWVREQDTSETRERAINPMKEKIQHGKYWMFYEPASGGLECFGAFLDEYQMKFIPCESPDMALGPV